MLSSPVRNSPAPGSVVLAGGAGEADVEAADLVGANAVEVVEAERPAEVEARAPRGLKLAEASDDDDLAGGDRDEGGGEIRRQRDECGEEQSGAGT